MMRILYLLLLSGLFTPVLSQTTKIGYVNWETIYSRLPQAQQLKAQLAVEWQSVENDLAQRQSQVAQLAQSYQASLLSPDSLVRKRARSQSGELTQRSEQLLAYTKVAYSTHQAKEEQLQNQLTNQVKQAIDAVAQVRGLSSVLPHKDAILYSDAEDITDLVLEKLLGN